MRFSSSWLMASAAFAPFVAPFAAPVSAQAAPYRFHDDHVLGASLDVVVMARDEASALMAVTAAKQQIARLDAVLSAWRPDSELERLNHTDRAAVSPDLYAVLERCEAWRAATGGAFDCRTGGALALWRAAEASGQAIDADALTAALADARQDIGLDRAGRSVDRPAGLRFTVDGLAKGYVIDAALTAARRASPDMQGMMIDIGGDLRCWGRSPQKTGWTIGVASAEQADNLRPDTALCLGAGRAVAASGRGARDLDIQGAALSHTLTPQTGRPVTQARHAVVVAPTAADADALATAFMVMAPDKALALADRTDGVDARITDASGAHHVSRGWARLLQAPEPDARLIRASYVAPALAAAAAPAAAQRGLGLDLTYQVPKIDAEPYHAPYVVMWLTDENRQMVRTLLVLGVKPKWAPENYVWWRRYGRQAPQVLDTVAKPTRPPGRYTAHWDGKDDTGKPVAPGRYILHVEAAREKGGHTYQTVDIDLTGAGGTKVLPAKDEMGAVDLRYGAGA